MIINHTQKLVLQLTADLATASASGAVRIADIYYRLTAVAPFTVNELQQALLALERNGAVVLVSVADRLDLFSVPNSIGLPRNYCRVVD